MLLNTHMVALNDQEGCSVGQSFLYESRKFYSLLF